MLDQKKNDEAHIVKHEAHIVKQFGEDPNLKEDDEELVALLKQLVEIKPNEAKDTELASKVKNEISETPAKHTDQSKLP
jgi:hypothetical protein